MSDQVLIPQKRCEWCREVTDKLYGGEGQYVGQCYECWTEDEEYLPLHRLTPTQPSPKATPND